MEFFLYDLRLTGNFIAWCVLLAIFIIKNKKVGLGGMLLLTYTISSFTTMIYYHATIHLSGDVVDVKPLTYMFVFSNIIMFPVYYHSDRLNNFEFRDTGAGIFLKFLILMSIPLSIEAMLETIRIVLNTNTASLGDIYESDVDVIGDKLSFIGRKTTSIIRWFTYLWPVLFWYMLFPKNKYRKYAIGPLFAMIQILLWSYAGAQRVAIVRYVFYIFIIYMLLKNNIEERFRKKVSIYGSAGVGCLIVLLFIITLSRFNNRDMSIDIWEWITLYTGQAPVTFCQHIWENDVLQYGDNTVSVFKEILGIDTFTDIAEKRDFYLSRGGAPTNIFYGMVGDFVYDFGLYATAGISVFIAYFVNRYLLLVINKGYLTLASIFILGLILLSFEFGFMYFCFKQNSVQHSLIFTIIFVFLYSNLKTSNR